MANITCKYCEKQSLRIDRGFNREEDNNYCLFVRSYCMLPCGVRGIRTPEPLVTTTRFPGVPLQPLEHLSFASATSNMATLSGTIHLMTRKGTKNI